MRDRGRIADAIGFMEKSVELAETTEISRDYATVVGNYAHLLTYAGKIKEAINLLTVKALPLAREVNHKDVLGTANSALSFAYFAAGNSNGPKKPDVKRSVTPKKSGRPSASLKRYGAFIRRS